MSDNKVTIRDVYEAIAELRAEISNNYVTKAEFAPVRAIVYGLVSVILLSVVGALVTLVLQK